MNKVITINLNGNAYQLEEGGYDCLRAYLETATARLKANPDREEILSDIERAIGEKFRALLSSHKSVVETKEVAAVVEQMGTIEVDSGEAPGVGVGLGAGGSSGAGAGNAGGGSQTTGEGPGPEGSRGPRRLYRISEGAKLCGVCNGIAAYVNLDPTLVRLAFVLLTLLWGSGLLVYIVLAIVVPQAHSPEEKAAASGDPATAQEFIRRAKEGYYQAMRKFPDRKARREWSRQFRREMRGWRMSFDREMRATRDQWRHNWQSRWAPPASVHPGMGFTLPFLSVLHAAATVLWFCVLISLLATGTVFGRGLPGGMPVWGAVLLLFVVYGILVTPLKAARRMCYGGWGGSGWTWSFVFLLDAVVWIAVAGVVLWLGIHYLPELREAVRSFPSVVHQGVHDIQQWWKGG